MRQLKNSRPAVYVMPMLVLGLLCFKPFGLRAQSVNIRRFSLHGHIRSGAGDLLAGVSVSIPRLGLGTSSNAEGFFDFSIPAGRYIVIYQLIGFLPRTETIQLGVRTNLNIVLQENAHETAEIKVSGTRLRNQVKNMEMGVQTLDMKTLSKLPSFLGEVDIIRSVLSLPGVSTVGEGATGFNVRGGGVDQNLVLMDQQQLFNSSHLFGFFSVYNPDAVMDATLIKGGIPARYGGRLSSILDVNLKSGNTEEFTGSGGLGSVSSRFSIGGPIQKGSSSFEISGRRSYADLFLKLSKDPLRRKTYGYFYDLNGKATFNMGSHDKLEIGSYYGKDVVNFAGQFGFKYGTTLGGVQYTRNFNNRFNMVLTGGISNYDNTLGIPSGSNGFEYMTRIFNTQLKSEFTYTPNKLNQIRFGVSENRYDVSPGKVKPVGDSSFFNTVSVKHQMAYESAVFLQNSQKITPNLGVEYGLRLSFFDYVASGADSLFSYSGSNDRSKEPVNGRLFETGKIIKSYFNPEPRISIRYLLDPETSLKASYNRTTQYIHLVSNTNAASPFDIWAVTSNNIRPEKADQVSLGYYRNYKADYEGSFELYYKRMYNQIDYVNGARTLLNKNLEGELLVGTGRSYGAEFYLKKNTGRLNGWISYTLSRTERNINGINNNNWYPAKYDRTNNLSVVATYDYSRRWTFGADFTFQTGVVTTFPNSRYSFEGIVIPYNSDGSRNNYRLPPYNRLDLSATLNNRQRPSRRFHSNWVFSIYNVYGRRNPYTIFFQSNKDNPAVTEAVRLSILGSVIPGVTWNFFF